MSGRKFPKPASDQEYLLLIERLARAVVDAAVAGGSFEVFLDEGSKSPLESAITDLAQSLRYKHKQGDGCVEPDAH